VFEPLGEHFRVVAPDLRGHGRGLKTWRRFRLEDCADDVAAVLERLDTGPVIAAGYSMGGPVAQLLWRRHRSQVAGLVLCATSDRMTPTSTQRFAQSTVMGAVMGTTRLGQLPARLPKWVARRILPKGVAGRPLQLPDWGMREVQRHDVRMLMEAGYAIGRHDAKPWIEGVDVPTSVVVTLEDRAIPARLQRDMAKRIRGSRVVDVQDGHVLCNRPAFAAPLLHACLEVKRRAYARGGDARTRRRKRGA
jgi:pimeloyl-ACP methyl ester carboxylesterase